MSEGTITHPVYHDEGNAFAADLVPSGCRRMLDIGCGSGDTSRLVKVRIPGLSIEGITHNPIEARAAEAVLDRVHVFNIEGEIPLKLPADFDCLLFSHVLEHVREPAQVVRRFSAHLVRGGHIVIAVPNVLEWRTRSRFLRGDWTYADSGVLDRTHVKFLTYQTAERELLGERHVEAGIVLDRKVGQGCAPLGPLRRLKAAGPLAAAIDRWGVRRFPNLCAQQVGLVATKSCDGAR